MSTLTIRNIEPVIKDKLRLAAAANGHSMEQEVRTILRNALIHSPLPSGLGSRIHARFLALGGVDLEIPNRVEVGRAANFDNISPGTNRD
jgi:antitoxin FitA